MTLGLATLALSCGAAACAIPQVVKQVQKRQLARHCSAGRTLTLTYDDGPGPDLTPRLLDLLAERRAVATFFPLGMRTALRPDVLDMVKSAGHELGTHTHSHLSAWSHAPWTCVRDIHRGYDALGRWARPDAMFRPPYGRTTLATWWALRRHHARIAWWTIAAGDTHRVLPDPQSVVDRVRQAGGGVVLMHDFDREPDRAAFVLETTRQLLDAAETEGWNIRPLGTLLLDTSSTPTKVTA